MPVDMTVRISGTRQILSAMNALPKEVNRRKEVLDPGLVRGAMIVRNAARELSPVETGVVRRNIIAQRWTRAENGMAATVVVRVRKLKGAQIKRLVAKNKEKGFRRYRGDPFYWRFVEFGTSKMKARSFMRKAFDEKKRGAVDAAIVEFRERVQIVVDKLGRRTLSERLDAIVLGTRRR